MVRHIILLFVVVTLFSCKSKEKETDKNYFPVLPYLQSQVTTVEKSVFGIKKITTIDSTHSDTVYLRHEDFRKVAEPFLSIPDISTGKLKKQYIENENYDEMLERAVIQYMPKKEGVGEISRQEVVIKPLPTGDTVTNIYIDRTYKKGDTSIEEHLQWIPGKSFQVYRTKNYPTGSNAEQYKVDWQ